MADAPGPITSPPAQGWQGWDATSEEPVAGWECLESVAGEIGFDGSQGGDHFASAPGAGQGPWKQT
jgi:hypothetical protein